MVGLLQVNPRNTGARSRGLAEVGYNLSGEDSEIMTTARSYKSKGSEPLKTDCRSPGLEQNWELTGNDAGLRAPEKDKCLIIKLPAPFENTSATESSWQQRMGGTGHASSLPVPNSTALNYCSTILIASG